MKNLFVPYELAVKLRKKGFDVYFIFGMLTSLYDEEGNFTPYANYGFMDSGLSEDYISAPLYQQVVDWFREKHDIIIGVDYKKFNSCGFIQTRSKTSSLYDNNWTNTDETLNVSYYQALNKAIEEAINLINL